MLPVGHKQPESRNPAHISEKLRVTLIEFRALHEAAKTQLGSTKSQLSNLRQNVKQLTTECSTYREIVTSRTSAMTVSVCVCVCVRMCVCVLCVAGCIEHGKSMISVWMIYLSSSVHNRRDAESKYKIEQ